MASKTYTQAFSDGTSVKMSRSKRQGRKSIGLGRPFVQRLYDDDEKALEKISKKFGIYYNKNDFIRMAVKFYINNVYTELLKQ